MSDAEEKDIEEEKVPEWESKLWSYISSGDGINCPARDNCKIREYSGWCFDDNKEKFSALYDPHVIDSGSDENELDSFRNLFEYSFPRRWECGIIFLLVEALANKYINKAQLNQPPVTTEIIKWFNISPSLEIYPLRLKAYHGAVWHLSNGWVEEKWAEGKDIERMAGIFQVTQVSMWIRLKTMGLV